MSNNGDCRFMAEGNHVKHKFNNPSMPGFEILINWIFKALSVLHNSERNCKLLNIKLPRRLENNVAMGMTLGCTNDTLMYLCHWMY